MKEFESIRKLLIPSLVGAVAGGVIAFILMSREGSTSSVWVLVPVLATLGALSAWLYSRIPEAAADRVIEAEEAAVVDSSSMLVIQDAAPQLTMPLFQPNLASIGNRLLASFLDGVIVVLVFHRLFFNFKPSTPFPLQQISADDAVSYLMGFAVLVIANGWQFSRSGQTIGKWVAGIRVVRKDGTRCSVKRWLVLRVSIMWMTAQTWPGFILHVVGICLGLGRDRRCLHDLIADTVVVKA